MAVRTTVDLPEPLHNQLRKRAAQNGTSMRALIIQALEQAYSTRPKGRNVTGPLIKGKRAASSGPCSRRTRTRMTSFFPDLNVWLALSFTKHSHSIDAWRWLNKLSLSNNVAENSMQPVALGRKNWLHVGSAWSGPKIAAILSVVESCRRLRVPVKDTCSLFCPA